MSSKQVYSQNIGYMWMSVWKDEVSVVELVALWVGRMRLVFWSW